MAKRLGKFELPKRLVKDEASATGTYAKYVAEPFETGFGHTSRSIPFMTMNSRVSTV